MAQIDKLIQKLLRSPAPTDLRWVELVTILEHFCFTQESNDGSRRRFHHEATGTIISLHKPHPSPEVKRYVIAQVVKQLQEMALIKGEKE